MKKKPDQKVTAIVCSYNEEKTIKGVIDTLLSCNAVDEIILADDGSKDKTPALILPYQSFKRVHPILLAENHGKGYAMTRAASDASGEILLFIDADLKNLNSTHISLLLEPIIDQTADMVLGTPVRDGKITLSDRLDPFRPLSGQRVVYRKEFLPLMDLIQFSGYGAETIINLHYREQGMTVENIFLTNLDHPIKIEKSGFLKSLTGYIEEGRQIMQTLFNNPKLVFGAYLGGILR